MNFIFYRLPLPFYRRQTPVSIPTAPFMDGEAHSDIWVQGLLIYAKCTTSLGSCHSLHTLSRCDFAVIRFRRAIGNPLNPLPWKACLAMSHDMSEHLGSELKYITQN